MRIGRHAARLQNAVAFSIASTSDQTDYCKYPYIVGNILSAVLPEQAAVWSYPVGLWTEDKALVREKLPTNKSHSI